MCLFSFSHVKTKIMFFLLSTSTKYTTFNFPIFVLFSHSKHGQIFFFTPQTNTNLACTQFLSTNISRSQSEMLHLLLVFFSWVFINRRFHLFGKPLVLSVLSCSIACMTHAKNKCMVNLEINFSDMHPSRMWMLCGFSCSHLSTVYM